MHITYNPSYFNRKQCNNTVIMFKKETVLLYYNCLVQHYLKSYRIGSLLKKLLELLVLTDSPLHNYIINN